MIFPTRCRRRTASIIWFGPVIGAAQRCSNCTRTAVPMWSWPLRATPSSGPRRWSLRSAIPTISLSICLPALFYEPGPRTSLCHLDFGAHRRARRYFSAQHHCAVIAGVPADTQSDSSRLFVEDRPDASTRRIPVGLGIDPRRQARYLRAPDSNSNGSAMGTVFELIAKGLSNFNRDRYLSAAW